MLTRMLLGRGYWEEAGGGTEGGGGGAAPDRGDDFAPTEPAVAAAPVEPEATPDPAVDKADPAVDKEVDKAEPEVDKGEAAPERDEKGRFIPKSRFDLRTKQLRETEVENRRLREENAALKTGDKATPAPTTADLDAQLDAIDEKIFAARKDGDIDAERKLMGEARKAERAHFEAQLSQARTQASTTAVETMSVDSLIGELEATHPALDPSSESFDKATTDELVELWEAYELKGYTRAQALLKAAAVLLPDASETAGMPEPPAAAAVLLATKEAAAKAKHAAGVKRNVDAAKKTPPNLDAVGGLDSDRAGIKDQIQASKLDEKDFADLPASIKARLRGDFL